MAKRGPKPKPYWQGDIQCCHCHKGLRVIVKRKNVSGPPPPPEYDWEVTVRPDAQESFEFAKDEAAAGAGVDVEPVPKE